MKRMIVVSAALLLMSATTQIQAEIVLTEEQEQELSVFSERLHHLLELRASLETSGGSYINFQQDSGGVTGGPDIIVTPGNPDNGFPGDPSDNPLPIPPTDVPPDIGTGSLDLPTFTRKSGAAEIIALESIYQTLMFYGVVHIIERKGTRKDFKIIQSRSGYFKNLTSLDIAFAIRTFSLYIQALLCNDPSMTNFAKMLSQVKPEQIGLRFKYDMAWALLGNMLPREPNQIMKFGTRWKALDQLLKTIPTLSTQLGKEQASELRSWASSVTDVVNILTRLNKIMCFVDARPDPREEIKKRMVVTALLDLDMRVTERYGDFKDIIDEMEAEGKKAKLDVLTPP